MTDVLILRIEDDVCVVDAGGANARALEHFVEKVAVHAQMPVEWAIVETVKLDGVGPGNVADNLSEPDDLPTATVRTCFP